MKILTLITIKYNYDSKTFIFITVESKGCYKIAYSHVKLFLKYFSHK